MKLFVGSLALAVLSAAISTGPSFAATLLQQNTQRPLTFKPPVSQYVTGLTKSFPCISREVYVPGPNGTLGYYKDSCTGAFIRPAVN
ncbi:hypothetical protein [Azospirillum endophyticum]